MAQIFISYSSEDHIVASYFKEKLEAEQISVWLDHRSLVAGNDWREEIDQGIHESDVVLVLLSPAAAESHYVTYEWARAMGRGKPVIPVRLRACEIHPRLQTRYYVDFAIGRDPPWKEFFKHVKKTLDEYEPAEFDESANSPTLDDDSAPLDPNVEQILSYLDLRGYQMVSFEGVRSHIRVDLDDDRLTDPVDKPASLFRHARLKGGKPGLARL